MKFKNKLGTALGAGYAVAGIGVGTWECLQSRYIFENTPIVSDFASRISSLSDGSYNHLYSALHGAICAVSAPALSLPFAFETVWRQAANSNWELIPTAASVALFAGLGYVIQEGVRSLRNRKRKNTLEELTIFL